MSYDIWCYAIVYCFELYYSLYPTILYSIMYVILLYMCVCSMSILYYMMSVIYMCVHIYIYIICVHHHLTLCSYPRTQMFASCPGLEEHVKSWSIHIYISFWAIMYRYQAIILHIVGMEAYEQSIAACEKNKF